MKQQDEYIKAIITWDEYDIFSLKFELNNGYIQTAVVLSLEQISRMQEVFNGDFTGRILNGETLKYENTSFDKVKILAKFNNLNKILLTFICSYEDGIRKNSANVVFEVEPIMFEKFFKDIINTKMGRNEVVLLEIQ